MEPPFHYSLSLNAGFEIARNPWVISVSSHCIPLSPHFLDQWRDFLAALPGDVAAAFGTRHFSEAEAQPELPVVIYDRKSPANTFNIFAGSSNGAYRRECWLLHPFETSISTGEDVEWGRWALATGRRTAWIPGVPVLYRHQGSFAYMFRKGWAESMVFADPQTKHSVLRLFLLNFASITKKLFLGKIPSGVWRRQMGHTMGVSAATAVLRWRALKSSK